MVFFLSINLLLYPDTIPTYTLLRVVITFLLLIFLFKHNGFLNKEFFFKNKLFIFFVTLLLIQPVISSFINTEFEIVQQLYISLTLLLYFLFINISIKIKNFISIKKLIVYILWGNTLIICCLVLFNQFHHISFYTAIKETFLNERFYNHIATLSIPLLVYSYTILKGTRKILPLFLMTGTFFLLFETTARGSLYSLFITLFILLAFQYKRVKEIKVLFFVVPISFLMFYFSSSSILTEQLIGIESKSRLEMYKTILPHVLDIKTFITAIGFSSLDYVNYGDDFITPHNIFLYAYLGGGGLGLVIAIILIFKLIKKIFIKIKKRFTILEFFLVWTLFSIFTHSMVSAIYISPFVVIFLLYFLASFTKYFFKIKRDNESRKTHKKDLFVIFTVLIIGSIVFKDLTVIMDFSNKHDLNKKQTVKFMSGITAVPQKMKISP